MKKSFKRCRLVLILLVLACPGLKSQDFFVKTTGERIQACTDRTMYISGEKVFFSVVIFNENDSIAEKFSRIFYCELITPDGNKIIGRKYLSQNFSGQGCLTIPEETISGIYFLKFYTRFMRNFGTDEYKYIMLKIINPFKTEVLPGNDSHDTVDRAWNSVKGQADDVVMDILSGKKIFSPREKIHLDIRGKNTKELPARICLSVIPEHTYKDSFSPVKNKRDTTKNEMYFPETRGISLTGQLIGKETGKPVPDAKVNNSIIGDKDILAIRTDSSGRFFFALPDYSGSRDIFLCADDIPGATPEILIDNDFCSRQVSLPSPRFTLNEEEMNTAYKLAINARIASIFIEDTSSGDSLGEEFSAPFYGEPSDVLVMDKYIDLPTLEEYFTELPVMVKLRKAQGRKQFRFFTTDANMSLYDPLMLVDWVAVNDIKKILAMSPKEIERIELVDCPYVKGNISYGGIISFVSKKNDFGGIDLPTSGTFVNYRFLEGCTENIISDPLPANLPDARNTVYWNPAIQRNDEGMADVSFTAPDTPGKYCILLREMRADGKVALTKEVIEVKK